MLYRDGKPIENPVNLNESTTKRYADEAIRFIEGHKAAPFFLYLCPNMPHTALHAGAEFRGKSPRGLYGDVVEELDHHVGRILDTLRAENLHENTLVFFTSDNGPWLLQKEHGGTPCRCGPARLRRGKAECEFPRLPGRQDVLPRGKPAHVSPVRSISCRPWSSWPVQPHRQTNSMVATSRPGFSIARRREKTLKNICTIWNATSRPCGEADGNCICRALIRCRGWTLDCNIHTWPRRIGS